MAIVCSTQATFPSKIVQNHLSPVEQSLEKRRMVIIATEFGNLFKIIASNQLLI
jgi:hypothetical protein